MMSALDPPLHERIYAGLKADYLAGDFTPGKRIDLQELADRHRSSKTPVREAAFILVGEELLVHHGDGGFVVPVLEPSDKIEMLRWHLQLVLGVLPGLDAMVIQNILRDFPKISGSPSALDVATVTGDFFTSLAAATGNGLASAQVRNLNDRLFYDRIEEFAGVRVSRRELETLTNSTAGHVHKTMRRRIVAYHQRKIDRIEKVRRGTALL